MTEFALKLKGIIDVMIGESNVGSFGFGLYLLYLTQIWYVLGDVVPQSKPIWEETQLELVDGLHDMTWKTGYWFSIDGRTQVQQLPAGSTQQSPNSQPRTMPIGTVDTRVPLEAYLTQLNQTFQQRSRGTTEPFAESTTVMPIPKLSEFRVADDSSKTSASLMPFLLYLVSVAVMTRQMRMIKREARPPHTVLKLSSPQKLKLVSVLKKSTNDTMSMIDFFGFFSSSISAMIIYNCLRNTANQIYMIKFFIFFLTSQICLSQLTPPISFTTIRAAYKWKHADDIARMLNVPGFHPSDFRAPYNIIALDGWTSKKGLYEACDLWANLDKYMGKMSRFGQNTSQIQQYLKSLYNRQGTKLLASAFGDYQFPLSQSVGPLQSAKQLAVFVKKNNLDGAVLEFVDSPAVLLQDEQILTSLWVQSFLKQLRTSLPNEIIVLHCFASDLQPKFKLQTKLFLLNLYLDYFVIKYYNTGVSDYIHLNTVFYMSTNFSSTSVTELIKAGIRSNKLIVGKPSKPIDSLYPESFIDAQKLGQSMVDMYTKNGWYGGYANNDLANDMQGAYMQEAMRGLQKMCDASGMCM